MTPPNGAWLDRMYNNRVLVPEHGTHLAAWAHDSAAVRQQHPCHLDLPYGNGLNETLDIFPTTQPEAPVLVFIHGGWWRSLDKADHSFIAPAFTQTGACVVLPNYALCPAVTVPDITLQMVHALAWTWRHVAEYGGDPNRITVVGHSAGGHLVTMLLACVWPAVAPDLPKRVLKNALSISGLYDLDVVRRIPYLKADLRLTPAQAKKASPAWLPRPAHGRLATVVGANESPEFIRHNGLMRAAWGVRRVPVCEALPGLNHFSVVEALAQPAHRLHALALTLLAETSP
ncbi:MAG: alpha/beta hydrolase [Pseudomonadota bacterium]